MLPTYPAEAGLDLTEATAALTVFGGVVGGRKAAARAAYDHINFRPPAGARAAAKQGLALRREHKRGGTAVGVARARDIARGAQLSPSTVRRMNSFFARHEVDKKGQGWDPGEEGYPSAGKIAWCLPWDARVLLADGTTMPIGEIVDNELPVEVVGVDEKTGQVRTGRVTDWFVADSTIDDFYLVGTEKQQRGGVFPNTYLEATGEHPFWTPEGWVPAADMAGKQHARVWEWLEADAEAYLIGTLLGDYHISEAGQVRGTHCAAQKEWLAEKARVLAALGGGDSAFVPQEGYGAGCSQVRYWSAVSRPLVERVKPLVYRDGRRVVTPEALERMGAIGLAALVCDDGSLHTDGRDGGESYRIHTEGFDDASVDALVAWLQHLVGDAVAHERENTDGQVIYVGRAGSRRMSELIAPYVPHCMRWKVCRADRGIPYAFAGREFKPVLVTCWHDTARHQQCGKDKHRRRHQRKRYLKRYDITVDGLHSFVANGVVVHNCLWGGDPGWAWAKKVVKQMEAAEGAAVAEASAARKACAKCGGEVEARDGKYACGTCQTDDAEVTDAAPADATLYQLHSLVVSTGFNRNGHFFPSEDLWAARGTLAHKPFNLEHAKDDIIGHSLRSWGVDAALNPLDEGGGPPAAFHLMDESVIYLYRPGPRGEALAATLDDLERGLYWVSMECLFLDFDYAVGHSPTGEFTDVVSPQVVKRTAATAHLTKYLRTVKRADGSRGPGRLPDGRLIGQALRQITFVGKGLVKVPANPASAVYTPGGRLLSGALPSAEGVFDDPVYSTAVTPTGRDMTPEQMQDELKRLMAEAAAANATVEVAAKAKESAEAAHAAALADLTKQLDAVKAELAAANDKLATAALERKKADRAQKVAVAFRLDEAKAAELADNLMPLTDEAFAKHLETVTAMTAVKPAAPAPAEPLPALASVTADPPAVTPEPTPAPAKKPDPTAAARVGLHKHSKGSK